MGLNANRQSHKKLPSLFRSHLLTPLVVAAAIFAGSGCALAAQPPRTALSPLTAAAAPTSARPSQAAEQSRPGSLPNVAGQGIAATVVVNGQLSGVEQFGNIVLRATTEGATVRLQIPVHFNGQETSPGLKKGGVLNVVRHSIAVICAADAIPNTSLQRTLQVRNAFAVPTPVLFSIECDNFATGSTHGPVVGITPT